MEALHRSNSHWELACNFAALNPWFVKTIAFSLIGGRLIEIGELESILLFVSDLQAAILFYVDLLGYRSVLRMT
jgi:hypothetical protein